MKQLRQTGFSLIELMIVVAIVGILGAVAYPAYTSSMLKGKRAEGRTALTDLMLQQERYFTQNNTYLAFTNAAGVTSPTSVPFKAFSGDNPAKAAYFLSAAVCSSTLALSECVQLSAAPVHSDPAYGSLTMQSSGAKSCTGTKSTTNECWK